MSRGKIVGDGAGQYKIGDVLGKGAFSTVYMCTRLSNAENFAVKVISKNDMRRDPQLEEALCREINSMEVIRRSPFITNMIEKLVSPRNYYIVMDLAKGGPLMQMIQKSQHGLHPNRARLYFRQLLLGISAMHDSDVVHRDIKPENLLLDETQTVLKISDFGFACYSPPDRGLYRRCGTVRYTAPEFYTDDAAPYFGRSVDLWAAGVTLYVMLFNSYPFGRRGDTDAQIIQRIQTEDVRLPPNRKISRSLEHLLRVMLRKQPLKRWELEKVKSHAWVMGVDDLMISIPRKKLSSSSSSSKKTAAVAPALSSATTAAAALAFLSDYVSPGGSIHPPSGSSQLSSSAEHNSPPSSAFPVTPSPRSSAAAAAFQQGGLFSTSGGGGFLLGATPNDEDIRFYMNSTLLAPAAGTAGFLDGASDTESDDQDYIAGGMHRRVRSCPTLPSVFFEPNVFSIAASPQEPASPLSPSSPRVVGSPTSTMNSTGLPQPPPRLASFREPSTESPALSKMSAQQLRANKKVSLKKAMRLSDMHHHATPVTPRFPSLLGGTAALNLSEAQQHDAFFTDLPMLKPMNASTFTNTAATAHTPQFSGMSSTTRGKASSTSPSSGYDMRSSSTNSTGSTPVQHARQQGSSPQTAGGGGGDAEGGRSSEDRVSPPVGSHHHQQQHMRRTTSFGRQQRSSTPTHGGSASSPGTSAGASSSGSGSSGMSTQSVSGGGRDRSIPLWRRLSTAHVRVMLNFCFFCATLLIVGALRVLLDVDARKLPLPQCVKDFLERVLAPPFEEAGDSLGTGGGNTMSHHGQYNHHGDGTPVDQPPLSARGAGGSRSSVAATFVGQSGASSLRRRTNNSNNALQQQATAAGTSQSSFAIISSTNNHHHHSSSILTPPLSTATPTTVNSSSSPQQQQQQSPLTSKGIVKPSSTSATPLSAVSSLKPIGGVERGMGSPVSGGAASSVQPAAAAAALPSPYKRVLVRSPIKEIQKKVLENDDDDTLALPRTTEFETSVDKEMLESSKEEEESGRVRLPVVPPLLHMSSLSSQIPSPASVGGATSDRGHHRHHAAEDEYVERERTREQSMRVVASHHDNLDDLLDLADIDDEDDEAGGVDT